MRQFHAKKRYIVGATDFNWDSMPPPVSHLTGEIGGFEVMLELMLLYPNLELSCPLATYADGDRWRVWTHNQATVSLRDLVGRQGLVSEEYMLCIRVGLGGQRDLQQEGCRHWKSNVKGGGRVMPL